MQVQSVHRIQTFVELKDFIYSTLCQLEQLAEGAFPVTWKKLKQGENLCGFLFSVQGPRSVTFNAVFESKRGMVHFYSSSGERRLSRQIAVSPSLLR